MDKQRSFPHTATEAAFLLGGIGTGNVSIGSRGDLRDWEIFNKPAKGLKIPYSFFALWCSDQAGKKQHSRVLEAPVQPPYSMSHGFNTGTVAGLPHMKSSEMIGEYPFVSIKFADPDLPLSLSLEAFTPFIPLNADDSGIPGAIFRYRVRNTSDRTLSVSVLGSLANVVGFKGFDAFKNLLVHPGGKNEFRQQGAMRGLFYSSSTLPPDSLDFGTMALVTTCPSVTRKETWLEGGWFDGIQDLWDDFSSDGMISPAPVFEAPGSKIKYQEDRPLVGSLCASQVLAAGEEKDFAFLLCWHFPNRLKGWHAAAGSPQPSMKNYYATRFPGRLAGGLVPRGESRTA